VVFNEDNTVAACTTPIYEDCSYYLTSEEMEPVVKKKCGQHKTVERNVSRNISARDNSVHFLPPLRPCTVKNCKLNCGELVLNVEHQQAHHETYCTVVKNAQKSGHGEGQKHLLYMMRSK